MANPIISIEDVTKVAGDRSLLSSVSFELEEQSLVSIIGPNGAGKSTLIKIILGLDTDYTGTVKIRPQERVQYIPQLNHTDHHQLPISVAEYISIGTTSLYSRSRAPVNLVGVLQHVGVSPDTLTQSYMSLSGGERQRIAIARALLAKPTILVLDEPLAAVDYASRGGLYTLIRHLQKDHSMTVLLVSHDIESVLPLSDRVLCLNKTLHTDCHPSAFSDNAGKITAAMHHHC